jgi:hypothetical protein
MNTEQDDFFGIRMVGSGKKSRIRIRQTLKFRVDQPIQFQIRLVPESFFVLFRIRIQQFTISADPDTDPDLDFAITQKVRFVPVHFFLLFFKFR